MPLANVTFRDLPTRASEDCLQEGSPWGHHLCAFSPTPMPAMMALPGAPARGDGDSRPRPSDHVDMSPGLVHFYERV